MTEKWAENHASLRQFLRIIWEAGFQATVLTLAQIKLFYSFYRLFIDYFCGQLRGADPPPLSWDPAAPMLPQSLSSLTFKHILPHRSEHEKPPFTARPPLFLPPLLSPSQMHCERGVSSHSPSIHLVTLRFGFHSYFSIKMAFTKFPRTSSNQ